MRSPSPNASGHVSGAPKGVSSVSPSDPGNHAACCLSAAPSVLAGLAALSVCSVPLRLFARRFWDRCDMRTRLFQSGELSGWLAERLKRSIDEVSSVEPELVRLAAEQVIDDVVEDYSVTLLRA